MSTLPARSKKRLAAIKDGTHLPKPRKAMKRTEFKTGTPQAGRLIKRAFGKTKKVGLRAAKAKCWKWYSMFIRLRDADEHGIVTCCTCPARKHWKDMDAGHYITRAKASVFIDEGNAHGQCSGCNRFQGGKFFEHMQFIVRTKGQEELDRIHLKASQTTKPTANDYLFWANCYKEQVQRIELTEPSKFIRP